MLFGKIYALVVILIIILMFLLAILRIRDNQQMDDQFPGGTYHLFQPLQQTQTIRAWNVLAVRLPQARPVIQPVINPNDPDQYFQQAQETADDSQNVHDSGITKSLSKKYEKLLEFINLNPNPNSSLNLTSQEIEAAEFTEIMYNLKNKCRELYPIESSEKLDIVMERIITIDSFIGLNIPTNGKKMIIYLWRRINQPDNSARKDDMIQRLLENILDCIDQEHNIINNEMTYCSTGIMSRLLNSLVLLDNDPILSEPVLDLATVNNLIYSKTSSMLQEKLKDLSFNELYLSETNPIRTREVGLLKNHIEETLNNEYKGKISDRDLSKTIQVALNGIL